VANIYYLMCAWYRKRRRLDQDAEADGVTVKTEPLIPGLDLVDDGAAEDFMDTGAMYIALLQGPNSRTILRQS